MTDAIDNREDIIDSRDVVARIEELEEEQQEAIDDGTIDEWEEEGYGLELDSLRELAAQASDYAEDWGDGEALIRDSYFEEYAEHYADDIGAIDANATWPLTHIDWEKAAEELKHDYTAVDFDGVRYWIR